MTKPIAISSKGGTAQELVTIVRGMYYRLPDGFQRALLVRRRERIWLEAGILFIHIPKAAGTSINQAIYGRFMGHVRATDIERWGSASLRALPSFAVTRNPWDRLVSAYRFGRRLHTNDWRELRAPRVVRDQVPQIESFECFVTDWLARQDIRRLNPIFQPQSLFVCDSAGKVMVDHLGRLEEMGPTYEFLRGQAGIVDALARANPSGDPVDYRQFYTPELVDLVGRIYADDVRNFAYSFDAGAGGRPLAIGET